MLYLRVIGRLLGNFFKGLGRFFMGFFRWIARHELFLGVVTSVVLVVFGVWLLLSIFDINIVIGQPEAVTPPVVQAQAAAVPTPTAIPQPTPIPVQKTDAPAATEAFMRGQINGNADQVWNSLNATLHTQLSGEGHDKSYFQRLFDTQRKNGVVYQGYQYVGGVPGDSNTSIHFYVMTVTGSDKKTSRVPWTFVVDNSDGKIVSAEFPS
ncbi:MAG TPA: hypothetical protein VH186_25855 [Chloroflexia bacterium]|nr:hypothetical protein [Chloroflexia bacterium]